MESKQKSAQNENRFSSLIGLIKSESIEEIKQILHKWSNLLNVKDRSGRTALHYCSEHSSALIADFLLEKSPNVLTAQDNDGYTALHLSVISGNQVMTRYLIGKSDSNFVNQCDNENHSAIHWATVCGQLECLHLLLNSGAHSSRADIHGAYPLHYSAQMCNPHSGICIGEDPTVGLAVLNRLLHCPDSDVNCVDSDGRTPLLWAASAGSADSLLALINAGANVAAKDKDGLTALHCASSRGHIDCVETLLTLCGSDVNQMDSNGCPPLFYAVTLGHADCTRLLIESGADVNAQDFKGRTAAHCGAARGQFETIKILGQLGANLWLRNSRGDLPLHEAIKSGRKELVKWLLDQIPAAVNATNSFGRSALHIAAINNNIEMCKILIDIGADVNTVMKTKGHFITPLDAALQKGYRGVAKYLLLHGALPASRISHSLNKSEIQRYPSGRPLETYTAFENSSPIETYDEWKARSHSTDSVLHSESQFNPMDSSRTQLPKLPTLVKNSEEKHIQETSSSTPSSLLENTSHYKNMREFETPLNDKPSNLKQAIITNVYVTNTPICHSKRVPPLKKMKKRRKTIQENDELKSLRTYTPSMSSSSSVVNGEENIKVVLETKDDSSFKSNDSMNERLVSVGENNLKNINESKSQDFVTKQYLEENNDISNKELSKHDLSDSKVDQDNKKSDDLIESKRDNDLGQNGFISKNVEVRDSDSKIAENTDIKNNVKSNKSVKNSELSDKSQSSQKSIELNRRKRSVSLRRSSVVDTNTSIEKKNDIKQKNINNKTNETKSHEKIDTKENTSKKSSHRMSARKEFAEKTKEFAENIDKQKVKDINKSKVRKGLIRVSKETADPKESKPKSEEKSDLSANHKISGKKTGEEDTDDNRDIDSITYIKSDNESVKSNVSSDNEKVVNKSEVSLQNAELKQDIKCETNVKEVPFDKSSDKEVVGERGEYDEYYDQWESDSEKTVIDSQCEQKDSEDINNNSIIGSIGSDRQLSKESNETIDKIDDKSIESLNISSGNKLVDKTDNQSKDSVNKSENNKSKVETNGKSDEKETEEQINENKNKNEEKKRKISPKEKINSTNGRIVGKVDEKITKSRTESKTSVKSKSSVESGKSLNNKNISSKDNKITEKRVLPSDKTKKQIERRSSISSQKSNISNISNKKNERKPSKVSEVKPKNGKLVEPVIKSSDSLENKSFLSTSDMSLNKSSDNQIVLKTSPLKNSISNQDINQYNKNDDKNAANFSSEESIFDSSLIMADMERDDSRMYSDINKILPKEENESPLEHIQRYTGSPDREYGVCTEYCNTNHKPESRCCHKLHFKTMPAHLGKVEVAHIGSRVDSRREFGYSDNVRNLSKDRVRRVRRVRPSSDGFKSIDPNIITQTVEKSLRKYQLERKLFEELHELKRFQIRSGRSNEILMVKRLIDKFRRDVKAPGMTDFYGNYTYKNYEFYLYDQLRRLSTSNEGKVALLTRSVSHQNIHIIRNSNENITQSSPELSPELQNIEGLDTNQQNISQTLEIDKTDNRHLSDHTITEIETIKQTTEEEVIEVVERQTVVSVQSQSCSQQDLGNNSDILNNFDNEFEVDVTNSELKKLDQSFGQNETTLTTDKDSTHYQNSEVMISENFRITEEVSHIIIDSKEQPNHRSEQKSDLSDSEYKSTIINEREEQNSVCNQSDESFSQRKQSFVEKIEEISEMQSNIIINEALNERTGRESSLNESNSGQQTETQNCLKNISKQISLESNESRVTDQVSDAKSTYGSTQSRSQYSGLSRRTSSKSTNISGKRRVKERQSFKKECLKPVVDTQPSERAKNRKKFKRIKTSIPPKLQIKVSTKEIRNRWKGIKETEMKKVLILSSHKQNELISGFTLWYELNKSFRERNQSFDSQIDRYIIENRSALQRTHSDSYLNRYKLDSKSISLEKPIK